jgi:hypothetical protein
MIRFPARTHFLAEVNIPVISFFSGSIVYIPPLGSFNVYLPGWVKVTPEKVL